MSIHPRFPAHWRRIESAGLGPFVSRMVFRLPGGVVRVWESRRHRKRRTDTGRSQLRRMLWSPAALEWWIAVLFTIGSAIFALGGLAGLGPAIVPGLSSNATWTNEFFFAGSIFFTAAAYLQWLESINADRKLDGSIAFRWFSWWPRRIGWLASFVQLVGTILFNLNTVDAMLPDLGWFRQDLLIWTPDIVGSVCFMVASQLAVQELCHGWWCWSPGSISWWVVATNWLGSVAFLISALLALVPHGGDGPVDAWWSTCMTFAGAICFLAGSLLLLPEAVSEEPPDRKPAC